MKIQTLTMMDLDLEILTVRFQEGANARWPIEDGGKEREIPARPLTLRVASGPEEAAGVAAEWGLDFLGVSYGAAFAAWRAVRLW